MLSIPHLIVIFVVALVVFGPEKLPDLARNLGKVMGEFRRATGDLRSTFEGHLRDLERETEQRRIGSTAPAASVPPPDAFVSAAGTVPATPPHEQATSAAEDEFPSPAQDASAEPIAEVPPATGIASHHNSETVSDGGNRPA
jgi:TatA/E family protein of Tat protein translocase